VLVVGILLSTLLHFIKSSIFSLWALDVDFRRRLLHCCGWLASCWLGHRKGIWPVKMQSEAADCAPRCRHLTNWTDKHASSLIQAIPTIIWKYDVVQKNRKYTTYYTAVREIRPSQTEPPPQVTRVDNLVKFGRVVFEICEQTVKPTNTQTYRQTDNRDTLITILLSSHPQRGRNNNRTMKFKRQPANLSLPWKWPLTVVYECVLLNIVDHGIS